MRKLILSTAATFLCFATLAAATAGDAEPAKPGAATFEALDKNADQQLSKIEAAADRTLSASFAAADSNGDGYLSRSEYLARSKPRS